MIVANGLMTRNSENIWLYLTSCCWNEYLKFHELIKKLNFSAVLKDEVEQKKRALEEKLRKENEQRLLVEERKKQLTAESIRYDDGGGDDDEHKVQFNKLECIRNV